jgi:hypothetical protein
MADPVDSREVLAVIRSLQAECDAVAAFIDKNVRAQVDARVAIVPHGIAFQGQLLRAIAWLRSLMKLTHPGDFQAVTAGARALFEGAVDVTLMHFDHAAKGPEKMDAWEQSAKLKHAETAADYLASAGRQPDGAERMMVAFAIRERPRIEKLRLAHWPNHRGKHPSRWTGRDLSQDAEAADKHLAEGFEEFYRLRYPQLCWNVHGSGLTGIANVRAEVIPYIGGEAAADAAKFGRVVAEVVTKHMGCWDENTFKKLAEQVAVAKAVAFAAVMPDVLR